MSPDYQILDGCLISILLLNFSDDWCVISAASLKTRSLHPKFAIILEDHIDIVHIALYIAYLNFIYRLSQ